jgi:signal transduction histidine kinase
MPFHILGSEHMTSSKPTALLRAVGRQCLLALLSLVLGACAEESLPDQLGEINQFEYVVSDSATPPPTSADWQPFTLPLGTRLHDSARSDLVYWLRTNIRQPAVDGRYGLYFYRYTKVLDLYFNGDYLGGDVRKPPWNTAAWNHPLLVEIQSANWRSGNNEVLLRLQTSRLGGVFAGGLFGDYQQLRALYDKRYFRQVRLNEWLLSFGLLVTALSVLLWFLRRQESLYWQFALVSGCWMLITYHMVVYHQPLPDRWWLPLVHVGIDGWIYSLSLFMVSWFGLQRPRQLQLQRWLLAIAVAWHSLALLPWWWLVAYVLHSIGIAFVLVLQYQGIRRIRQQGGQSTVLVLIVFIQLLCYLHDLYALVLTPEPDWQTSYHWSQFAFPLMQAIFLVGLILRFIGALSVAEGMNQLLETRVSSIRQQLEMSYAKTHQAEMLKAAEEERSRIYRDLHDDVGSKLLSIAHAGRDTRLGGLASAALESLRDAVARVNNPATGFHNFLSTLREEMNLRLTSLGLVLHWSQPAELEDWTLSSSQNHHLSRIFRELVSNIIRHSAATEVDFRVEALGDIWCFTLADNGKGMAGGQGTGSGLQNLRSRAEELGLAIQWSKSSAGGVLVSVLLPAKGLLGVAAAP